MKISNPELRELLAAEYMLGTLDGAARKRFERMLEQDPDLQRRVTAWQERLWPLGAALPEQAPPAAVWRGIDVATRKQQHARPQLWQMLAIAASLLAVVLGASLWHENALLLQPVQVALLGNGNAPAWVLTLHGQHALDIRAERPPGLPPGHAYQLWMLPGSGRPPQSLGLLPDAPGKILHVRVPSPLALARAQGIAVSLEPAGGSPLPGPSGPVVYSAAWVTVHPAV